jgi:hypothetical protein
MQPEYILVPGAKPKPDTVYLPTQADTLAILERYFSQYSYTTVHTDSNIDLKINQKISQNAIQSTQLTYHWLRADTTTETHHHHTPTPKNTWFVGANAHASPGYVGAGPTVKLLTPNNHLFGVNLDLVNRGAGVEAAIPIRSIFKKTKQ